MILKFSTKRDINGNRYTLVINTDTKTFSRSYNPFNYTDYITISKTDKHNLQVDLLNNGYQETNTL